MIDTPIDIAGKIYSEIYLNEALNLDDSNFNKPFSPLSFQKIIALSCLDEGLLGYSAACSKEELLCAVAENESLISSQQLGIDEVTMFQGGCTGTLDAVVNSLAFLSGRDEIVVSLPQYPIIYSIAKVNGCNIVPVTASAENNFLPDPDEIRKHITDKTMAVLITEPGNPACVSSSPQSLKEIEKACLEKGAYLIVDAIYEEMNHDSAPLPFLNYLESDQVIKIKGPSKDRPYFNDLRLGYVISRDRELNLRLFDVSVARGWSPPLLNQNVFYADILFRILMNREDDPKKTELLCYGDEKYGFKDYSNEISEFKKRIKQGVRKVVSYALESDVVNKVIEPTSGNVVFMKMGYSGNITDLTYRLANDIKVGVLPGTAFGLSEYDPWIRINVTRDPNVITKNLGRVFDYVRKARY